MHSVKRLDMVLLYTHCKDCALLLVSVSAYVLMMMKLCKLDSVCLAQVANHREQLLQEQPRVSKLQLLVGVLALLLQDPTPSPWTCSTLRYINEPLLGLQSLRRLYL